MIIRIFDLIFSSFGLIVLSPILLPVYLVLKCTGQHQAFYVQKRIGKGGKEFGLLKFVTMVKNAETLPGGYLTQKNDPRVLPFGRFLRKTKINELPQLINIFLGHMSFVGPRPLPKDHFDLYNQEIKQAISKIEPGLTGMGSVVFRDEEGILDTIEGDRNEFFRTVIVPYKGQLELWFCTHKNIFSYVLLILLTAWSIIRPRTIVWLRLFPSIPPVPYELRKALGINNIKLVSYKIKRFIA